MNTFRKRYSFIPDVYLVPLPVYNYLVSLQRSNGFNDRLFRFLAHVVCSTLSVTVRTKRKGSSFRNPFHPIPSKTIEKSKHFRKLTVASISELDNLGLLQIDYRYRPPTKNKIGQCRRFALSDTVFEEVLTRLPERHDDYSIAKFRMVDIFSGSRRVTKKEKSKRDRAPDVLKNALKNLGPRQFNLKAIIKYLDSKQKDAGKSPKKERQFRNDRNCFLAVLRQQPKPVDEAAGVWEYKPAYRIGKTGRIYEIGGGMMSCSKSFKYVSTHSIPNLFNYDLQSSQPFILRQILSENNLNTSFLDAYMNDPEAKDTYSIRCSLSIAVWKTCYISLLMGAQLDDPSAEKKMGAPYMSILKYWEGVAKDREKENETEIDVEFVTESAYKEFYNLVLPLVLELRKWHEILISTKPERGKELEYTFNRSPQKNSPNKPESKEQRRIFRNACGLDLVLGPVRDAELYFDHPRQREAVKRKLAAHVLQAREAQFIHSLTALGPKYGFRPMANEHDGLITMGEIPQDAVEEAAANCLVEGPILVEKPIIEEEKVPDLLEILTKEQPKRKPDIRPTKKTRKNKTTKTSRSRALLGAGKKSYSGYSKDEYDDDDEF